jgi:hypothetical protein
MTSWQRGHSNSCSIDISSFVIRLLGCLSSAFSNCDACIFDIMIRCSQFKYIVDDYLEKERERDKVKDFVTLGTART